MYRPNLQSVASPVPGIIAIAVLGWDCEPPVLEKGIGCRGSEMVPFERALVRSYRPIVTFHPFLRVSDIAAFVISRN